MARRLKHKPWTEQEQAYKHILDQARKNQNLPETASLCRLVIASLLCRISKRNPKEARFLRQTIALLAGAERLLPATSKKQLVEFAANPPTFVQSLEGIYRQLLLSVITSKVPRTDHDKHTLSDQRKRLVEYMKDYPVKPSASLQEYRKWLTKHSSKLYEQLSFFPCLCEYRASFSEITNNELDLLNCRGPADVIFIVLAELHRTTPSAVRKILSHSKLT